MWRRRVTSRVQADERLPEPPGWLAVPLLILGLITTYFVLSTQAPEPLSGLGVPVWFGCSFLWYVVFRFALQRRYRFESLPQSLLIRSTWRRRPEPIPWWDYTPEEIAAMSLDDLRHANERALDELEPLHPDPRRRRSRRGVQTPTAWQDRLEPGEHAELVRERYERLRDAYYQRRGPVTK